MDQIVKYLLTILQVFVFLSSVLIIFMLVKFLITNKKGNLKRKSGFRGQQDFIDINPIRTNSDINVENKPSKVVENKLGKNEKVIKYDNGEIYKGEIINGKRSGFGVCIFTNQERYEGLWKDDMMHCVGKYIFSDGAVYTGDFKDGLIEGLGMYRYTNKDIYKGYVVNNKKEGKGILYYKDGCKYSGMWKDDKQCGEGELSRPNGDIYKGAFVEGKFNGKGEYCYSNGCKYIGEFKNNVFHGHGCFTELNGDIYEGEYKYGCKRGYGILKTRHNGIYEGEFKDDLFDGTGRYIYNDKSIYEGDFKKGKRDGIGTYTCKSYKYVGEWKDNFKGEIGTYHLPNQGTLDVVIKEKQIVEGIYRIKDEEEKYIYNININNTNEEIVMENIEDYLKRKNNNHYNQSQLI